MPRFFFDIQDQHRSSIDDMGIDCATLSAARDAAIDALPDVARDVLPDGDHHVITVSVRDAGDKIIFMASLTLKAGWLDQN
ncbi:hypothetical protein [Aurantimonas sp. 22II-16-19i]|uniref:DUF6894 family protein n=1 Tax=Aurantimonas sp. 22II-16-19i TaxID=1317114 RepID=UPI0009F7C37B|nr:hypothetical protein [Aurantimonas sp. 22II-16-19i]ORE85725.1 hypothetical protein ATO4_26292 [Aurantimonas sp. 22II-16-19i]